MKNVARFATNEAARFYAYSRFASRCCTASNSVTTIALHDLKKTKKDPIRNSAYSVANA
ncbi:hypothetical protein [Hydrogenophaga sp.]|uniref:hypothetical protein n=1 Tax=Hydrogenophaga sp. TaxID=1904254 RepID=UPI0025C47F73|nr:hypothetical protein [Hydrogenophaga sp.]